MLKAENISKTCPTPRGDLPILDGVSLQLARGQAAAIMGPSGSGKSTLLYILGALDPPTSGRVSLEETDPYRSEERRVGKEWRAVASPETSKKKKQKTYTE